MLAKLRDAGAEQAAVEHVFDGELELGAGRGFLPPVENEKLLEFGEELADDLLDLRPVVGVSG